VGPERANRGGQGSVERRDREGSINIQLIVKNPQCSSHTAVKTPRGGAQSSALKKSLHKKGVVISRGYSYNSETGRLRPIKSCVPDKKKK